MGAFAKNKHQTTRREFILLSGAALAIAQPAFADQKKPKIGYLSWFPQSMNDDLDRFREGMRELGYTEPTDYALEGYFTGGNPQLTRDRSEERRVGKEGRGSAERGDLKHLRIFTLK